MGDVQPTIQVTLTTLDGRLVVDGKLFPIDTGFAGTILLPRDIFDNFEKAELPESESRLYRTLVGPIPMRTARAILRLPFHDEAEILVDTPAYGVGKSLLGLRALTETELLLDGHNSQTCLLRERTE
jgi:predicted aspartyl protease